MARDKFSWIIVLVLSTLFLIMVTYMSYLVIERQETSFVITEKKCSNKNVEEYFEDYIDYSKAIPLPKEINNVHEIDFVVKEFYLEEYLFHVVCPKVLDNEGINSSEIVNGIVGDYEYDGGRVEYSDKVYVSDAHCTYVGGVDIGEIKYNIKYADFEVQNLEIALPKREYVSIKETDTGEKYLITNDRYYSYYVDYSIFKEKKRCEFVEVDEIKREVINPEWLSKCTANLTEEGLIISIEGGENIVEFNLNGKTIKNCNENIPMWINQTKNKDDISLEWLKNECILISEDFGESYKCGKYFVGEEK